MTLLLFKLVFIAFVALLALPLILDKGPKP
jgi:hypothetical protein